LRLKKSECIQKLELSEDKEVYNHNNKGKKKNKDKRKNRGKKGH
jgi:hypothetical protein